MRAKMRARAASPIPDGPQLGTYDAARLAGVLPDTIVRWVKVGRRTKVKVKGKLSIARAELEALMRFKK
jgi:hypothetical protein